MSRMPNLTMRAPNQKRKRNTGGFVTAIVTVYSLTIWDSGKEPLFHAIATVGNSAPKPGGDGRMSAIVSSGILAIRLRSPFRLRGQVLWNCGNKFLQRFDLLRRERASAHFLQVALSWFLPRGPCRDKGFGVKPKPFARGKHRVCNSQQVLRSRFAKSKQCLVMSEKVVD